MPGSPSGAIADSRSASAVISLVPVVARDVQELRGRLLHRGDDLRMRVAGRADRDAGREIEEPVAIHVPGLGAAAMRHHERIIARVRRRDDPGVALDHRAGLRPGQLGLDVRVLHGFSDAFCQGHMGSLTGSRCAAAVRASRARNTESSAADGASNRLDFLRPRPVSSRRPRAPPRPECRGNIAVNVNSRSGLRLQDADVRDDDRRPAALRAARGAALKMPAAGAGSPARHKAARRGLHDDEDLLRVRRNVRSHRRRPAGASSAWRRGRSPCC